MELNKSSSKASDLQELANKDLVKLLNYNAKRKEFDEDEKEEVLGELNFDIPNYSVKIDSKNIDNSAKKEGRKRGKHPKEKEKDLQVSFQRKMGAIHYYNSILDKRLKNHRIVQDWGLLDNDINYMEKIIRESEDEREFVNTMKIFARFNTPTNHVNLMNSLLLEKNIREMIKYLKESK